MPEARIYHNAKCLKCEKVEEDMVILGPMIFCESCFLNEFYPNYMKHLGKALETFNIIDTKSEIYKKWIRIYKEK
jgi:hypothetical protein